MKVHFGKHRGKDIEEIPSDYLRWLVLKCDNADSDLIEEAEKELSFRDRWKSHFYEEKK